MKNITYKKTVIGPFLTKIEIEGVEWLVRECDHEDLKDAEHNGHHVSDWAWFNARYEAYCVNKQKHFYLSRHYIQDIKEIMGLA